MLFASQGVQFRDGAQGRGGKRVATAILSIFPVIVIFLSCILPLAWLLVQILFNPVSISGLRMDGFRWGLLGRTLTYNLAAGVLATVLALPAAFVLGRGRGRVTAVLWFLLPLTLLLPSLMYAYGWAQFVHLLEGPMGKAFGYSAGRSPALLKWLGLMIISGTNGPEMRLEPAGRADVARCVMSLAAWLWPLPAGLIGLALRRMDSGIQQHAMLDGALWRVTARQLAGPIVAGVACVAVLAVQEFAVYEPTGVSVVATEVRQVFQTGAFSSPDNPLTMPIPSVFGMGPTPPDAGVVNAVPSAASGAVPPLTGDALQQFAAAASVATALPLLLVVAFLGIVALWNVRRLSASEDLDVDAWPASLEAGRFSKILAFGTVALTLGVPVIAMVLRHRIAANLNPLFIWAEAGDKIIGSLVLAGLTAIVAIAMAFAGSVRRRRGLVAITLATFLLGGQLLAIALLRLYNRPGLGWVSNAPPIAVMAYLSRFGWLVLLAAGATWSPPWRRLRDLAAVDGAGSVRTATGIVWPLAWPLLIAASLLVLILSLTEVPATVLISPPRPQPVIPMLMTWVHLQRSDEMIEVSLLLMGVVVLLSLGALGLLWMGIRLAGGTGSGDRSQKPNDRSQQLEARNQKTASINRGKHLARFRFGWLLTCGFGLLLLCSAGCSDPKQPKAIWCETGTAPGQVVYPRAIAYSAGDDTFWIIDRVARVQHLDRKGQFINGWRMPEFQYGKPVGVAVGPDGNLYVPDTHYHRVMVYAPDGKLLRQWGREGNGPGEFIFPTDVAFDKKGRIFVSEYGGNDRVQVFDASANKLFEFGKFGNADGEFARPQTMVIDHDLVYITDACNHRLCVFTTDGTFVRNMGGVGSELGQFRFPYGLAEDADGYLIVCEFGNNRVQRVDKQTGKGLQTWGAAGREPGELAYPWGVAVDRNGRIVAVDAGNNRLQVFEF